MNKYLLCLPLLASLGLYACQPKSGEEKKATEVKEVKQSIMPRQQLEQLTANYKADIGIALIHLEKGDSLSLHNDRQYPMQSTYKFPLALAILDRVDKGILRLEQKVHVDKKDLRRSTWSPLRDKYPDGNIDITLKELLQYSVSQSDNNACDVLFRLIGGPHKVQEYLLQHGIKDISVKNTETEMATAWQIQYDNRARPSAMAALLRLFYQGKLLTPGNNDLLLRQMTESANSDKRIKGLLPAGTLVAHKTGTSDTNDEGVTAATNDVGIITLPDGGHIALAVFVSNSKENHETNERIIAEVAKAVFDHYSQ